MLAYQQRSKELVASFFIEALTQEELDWLSQQNFYGDNVRVDTRTRLHRETGHSHRMSVYRPQELAVGISLGVRLLCKSHQGTLLYKLVLIPAPQQDFHQETKDTLWGILTTVADLCQGWSW